jgi:hypothetical protein
MHPLEHTKVVILISFSVFAVLRHKIWPAMEKVMTNILAAKLL